MSIHAHKSYGVCNKTVLHHSISYLFIWKNIKFLIFWTCSKIPDKTSVICQLCYFFYFYFPTFISQVTLKTFFPSGWIFWILWHLLLLQPLPHLQIYQGKIFLSFLLCLASYCCPPKKRISFFGKLNNCFCCSCAENVLFLQILHNFHYCMNENWASNYLVGISLLLQVCFQIFFLGVFLLCSYV